MDNNSISKLRYWCYKVLPLVYDDALSYAEQNAKIAYKVNEMIDLTNEIPELVDTAVSEGLTNERIIEALSALLAQNFWVNVKLPPTGVTAAKGDGNTDDTQALTECINYGIAHDMAVFFPAGDYKVSQLNISNDDFTAPLTLLGCGSNSSIIYSTYVGSVDVITLAGNFRGLTIRGLGFVGSGSYSGNTNSMLHILLGDNDYSDITISDITIMNAPRGITMEYVLGFNLDNITILSPNNEGIYFNECNMGSVNNLIIAGVTSDKPALYFNDTRQIVVNNAFLNTASGVDVVATDTTENIYAQFVSSGGETPYTDSGTDNDFDVLFNKRDWEDALSDLDTALSHDIDVVSGALDDEVTNRTDADNALGGRIDDEIRDRGDADTALGGRIDDEILDRQHADGDIYTYINDEIRDLDVSALEGRVDNLETSVDDIINARLYNVKDFGAVGDGVTDDTQAIKDCLTYMAAHETGGNKCSAWAVFPTGQYLITSQIVIPEGCGIKGTMPRKVIHVDTGTPTPGTWLYINDTASVPTYNYNAQDTANDYGTIVLRAGSVMDGFGIYYPEQRTANLSDSVTPYRYAIKVSTSIHEFSITNIMAANPYSLIYIDRAVNKGRIRHIYGTPLRNGITMVREADIIRIDDVHFHGNYYSRGSSAAATTIGNFRFANLIAFEFAGCDWPALSNAFVYGCDVGIRFTTVVRDINNGSWSGTRFGNFTNVGIEHTNTACVQDNDNSDNFPTFDAANGNRHNVFTDCTFDSTHRGLSLGNGREWMFTNCNFRCDGHAAFLYVGTSDCLINDATFTGCNFIKAGSSSLTGNLCAIASAAKTLTVTGCMFHTGDRSYSRYLGIRVYNPCASVTVVGNTFHNYEGYCFDVENSSTTTAYFLDNVFENCASNVTYLNAGVTKGVVQTGDGSTVRILDTISAENVSYGRIIPGNKPTHVTDMVELYVDTSGNLCYTSTANVKRTLSYT